MKPAGELYSDAIEVQVSVIESLSDDDSFRIVLPQGVIEMTKRQFKEHFSNVRTSASYREVGIYHYPKLPRVAMQFLREGAKPGDATE